MPQLGIRTINLIVSSLTYDIKQHPSTSSNLIYLTRLSVAILIRLVTCLSIQILATLFVRNEAVYPSMTTISAFALDEESRTYLPHHKVTQSLDV